MISDQAVAHRHQHRLVLGGGIELALDVAQVEVHRVLADGEDLARGPGRFAVACQAQDVQLARRQVGSLVVCRLREKQTLRRILVSRGVSLSTGGMATLMLDADQILGVANFSGRLPESDRNATGSLTRLYDILIAAAVQLVPDATTDRLGTSPACRNERLFNADGSCNADGFGCLVGTPVSTKEMERCSQLVADAAANTNLTNGRRLAVAAVAATYFLCD